MKREEIKAIFPDATDEQLKSIMDMNGTDVEKAKSKVTALETEIKEKKEAFDKLNTEFETLKNQNASAEDWKAKFEALQAENVAKEKQAIAEKNEREKEENNRLMFNNAVEACGKSSKDWNGKFTEEGYYREFVKAIELDENKGKAHKDILYGLYKDDETAWKGVTPVKLVGGANKNIGNVKTYGSKSEIMNIKDASERQAAIAHNIDLFKR